MNVILSYGNKCEVTACWANCCQGATIITGWCSYSQVKVGVNRARVTGLQGWSRRELEFMGELGLVAVVSGTLQAEASTCVTWGQSLRHSSGASLLRSSPNPPDAPLSRPSPPSPPPPPPPAIVPLCRLFSLPLRPLHPPPPPLAPLLNARPPPESGSSIAMGWGWRRKQKSSTCKAERKPSKAWILSTERERETWRRSAAKVKSRLLRTKTWNRHL